EALADSAAVAVEERAELPVVEHLEPDDAGVVEPAGPLRQRRDGKGEEEGGEQTARVHGVQQHSVFLHDTTGREFHDLDGNTPGSPYAPDAPRPVPSDIDGPHPPLPCRASRSPSPSSSPRPPSRRPPASPP